MVMNSNGSKHLKFIFIRLKHLMLCSKIIFSKNFYCVYVFSVVPDDIISKTHPVQFDRIDVPFIRKTTLRMDGAAGPSAVDAAGWKRLCTSFGAHSADLCHAISSLAKTICTTYVDPNALEAFLADWTNVQMSDPLESVIIVGKAVSITLKSVIHNSKKVLAQFIYCWHIQEGGPVVCQIHFIGFVNIWHCRWH